MPYPFYTIGHSTRSIPEFVALLHVGKLNAFWINQSFHNYADYALSAEFHDGLARLVSLGRERQCAVMCSEALWWRCHRRIVADYLISRGESVFHLMSHDKVVPAKLTDGVRAGADGCLSTRLHSLRHSRALRQPTAPGRRTRR
nr:DUF488 domain-containing protein [Mesorhizobium sp. WSM4875]